MSVPRGPTRRLLSTAERYSNEDSAHARTDHHTPSVRVDHRCHHLRPIRGWTRGHSPRRTRRRSAGLPASRQPRNRSVQGAQ